MTSLQSIVLGAFVSASCGNLGLAQEEASSISQQPLPRGILQTVGVISNRGGIVELEDGALMLAEGDSYQISTDTARTWGEEQPLNCPIGAMGLIRLRSGELAIYGDKKDGAY